MPDLLAALAASEPTSPRLTWYDDADGPTRGERIELSGRVLATWTAKAASALVDDLDVERGDTLALDLPPHWRTAYWALAGWRVGALVRPGRAGRALVTDDPGGSTGADAVVAVSLPALARGWAGPALPAGVVDEARDLAGHPDVFEPYDPPDGDDPALALDGGVLGSADLVRAARGLAEECGWGAGARVLVNASSTGPIGPVLLALLAVWSVDGSAVLVRDADGSAQGADDRWVAERVTSAWPPAGTPSPR